MTAIALNQTGGWLELAVEAHKRIRDDIGAIKTLAETVIRLSWTDNQWTRSRAGESGGMLWRLQVDSLQVSGFIGAHHQSEYSKVWPKLRQLKPIFWPDFETIESKHAQVVPKLDYLVEAARDLGTESGSLESRKAVLVALEEVEALQLPAMEKEDHILRSFDY